MSIIGDAIRDFPLFKKKTRYDKMDKNTLQQNAPLPPPQYAQQPLPQFPQYQQYQQPQEPKELEYIKEVMAEMHRMMVKVLDNQSSIYNGLSEIILRIDNRLSRLEAMGLDKKK